MKTKYINIDDNLTMIICNEQQNGSYYNFEVKDRMGSFYCGALWLSERYKKINFDHAQWIKARKKITDILETEIDEIIANL